MLPNAFACSFSKHSPKHACQERRCGERHRARDTWIWVGKPRASQPVPRPTPPNFHFQILLLSPFSSFSPALWSPPSVLFFSYKDPIGHL